MEWWVLPVAGSVTGGWQCHWALAEDPSGWCQISHTDLLYIIIYDNVLSLFYIWLFQGLRCGSSVSSACDKSSKLSSRCWLREVLKVRTSTEYSECQVPVSARLCLLSPNRIVGCQALSKTMEGTAELEGRFRAASPALLWVLPLLLANHPLRSISDCSVLKLQGSNWFSLRRKS